MKKNANSAVIEIKPSTPFGYEESTLGQGTYQFVPATTNPLVAGLENASNLTVTENGALAYVSTLNYLLDFFGNAGALRTRTEEEIVKLFTKSFAQDKLLTLKVLFYIRDVRGGQGERRTFRIILKWLANNYPEVVKKNILNVSNYGRWDDMYSLFGTSVEKDAMTVMANQLASDWRNMKAEKSVSLLAKWLKSENTSSKESRHFATQFRKALGWNSKKYRKTLSQLRDYINVVEVKMCANQWNSIDFEKVPSKATSNYKKAFEKKAGESYKNYLSRVEKGEAVIHSDTLYPYDILRDVVENGQTPTSLKTADLQWKALPNFIEGDGKGLVIADTSGSMHGLPLYVAVSLAIYFAERNNGPFKDVFLTFSNHPAFHRLVGNNICEKWNNLDRTGWDMNTNLQASFDLILQTAIQNRVAQKDMPTTLLVVSDMQFDVGNDSNNKTNFEIMKEKFKNAGYNLPNVVWWQVNSRKDNVPIKFNDMGVALVSGSHPSILKQICTSQFLTPVGLMMKAITDKRYDAVVI